MSGTILSDILNHPTDAPVSLHQAATVMNVSVARVVDLVRLGVLTGRIESGERVTAVDRRSILNYLHL